MSPRRMEWAECGGTLADVYDAIDPTILALKCPVCRAKSTEPLDRRGWRHIQIITGPDTWDTYACPGCLPVMFVTDARKLGENEVWIEKMLVRAAADVAGRKAATTMNPSPTDGLWFRMLSYALAEKLSYGLGADHISGRVVAHVGKAMGTGNTSNEAINACADQLASLGWQDDRR